MTDRFSGYQKSPDEPYTDAVPLVPSNDEFEPTAALWINYQCTLSVVMMDGTAPVTIFTEHRGRLPLRIKKLLGVYVPTIAEPNPSATINEGEADEFEVHYVLGLY